MSLKDQIAAHRSGGLRDQIAAHRASAATPETVAPPEAVAPPSLLTKTGRAGRAERSAAQPGTGESRFGTMAKDFGQGVYTSAAELSMGLQDLVGLPGTEGQRAALDEARQGYKDAGPMAGVGRMGGEVAQYAVPGKMLHSALKTVKGLPQMLSGASAGLSDVLASGAVGAVQLPDEGETRGGGAVGEMAASLGGTAVGKLLSKSVGKLAKGIDQTPAAQRLADKGIELTPGQAAKGGLPRSVEYISQVLPFASKGRRKARDLAAESMNKALLKDVAPEGYKKAVAATGTTGMRQLSGAFTDAYQAAWGKATRPKVLDIAAIRSIGGRGKRDLGEEATRGIDTVMREVSELTSKFSPKRLNAVDNMLRRRIRQAEGGATPNYEYAQVLKGMRDRLRGSVGDDALQSLNKVDAKYGDYLVLQKSGGGRGALQEGALIQPSDLERGIVGVGKEARVAKGQAPMQGVGSDIVQTMGRKEPKPLINAVKGFMQNAPDILPMRLGGEVAMGRTGVQKLLRDVIDKPGGAIAKALREAGISPGTLGAALED